MRGGRRARDRVDFTVIGDGGKKTVFANSTRNRYIGTPKKKNCGKCIHGNDKKKSTTSTVNHLLRIAPYIDGSPSLSRAVATVNRAARRAVARR